MMFQKPFFKFLIVSLFFFAAGCTEPNSDSVKKKFPVPKIDLRPHGYVVYKIGKPLQIDGKLKEKAWAKVKWTTFFVNIKGKSSKKSVQKTRAKLLWDKDYLYIAAVLEEKDIWGTMKKRDSPLFLDNAFEIFIDPDGDTQNYLEFEINALSTIWDLLLTRPSRDGGYSLSGYNILDLKKHVYVDGTLNDSKDEDNKWVLEIAFPMKVLTELKFGGQIPVAGEQWRVQLARAERKLDAKGGNYKLKVNPKTNKSIAPKYSSWAPQGLVNLHYPEMWGFIQFSDNIAGEQTDDFILKRDEKIKWALRKVYYHLKQYYLNHGTYPDDLSKLNLKEVSLGDFSFSPIIKTTKTMFEVSSKGFDEETTWVINQNGKIWCREG